jgi:uncharacterized protein YuzE
MDRYGIPAEVGSMSITIGDITFDNNFYDAVADVLYLHVGDPASAVDFDESDGHALRFDSRGRLVGITIVGARRLLESDDRLIIAVPEPVRVDRARLAEVLAAA